MLQVEKDPTLFNRLHFLYELRKKCLTKRPQHFLNLYKNLILALIEASSVTDTLDLVAIVENTFSRFIPYVKGVEELPNLFYQLMLNLVEAPVDTLEEEWLSQENKGLVAQNNAERYEAALLILRNAVEEQWKLFENHPYKDFLMVLRKVFEDAFIDLILQHFSEKIGFKPPQLSEFERKLQASLLQQQTLFLTELNQEEEASIDLMSDHLTTLLEKDIELFRTDTLEHFHHIMQEGVEEIEVYYNFGYLMTHPYN